MTFLEIALDCIRRGCLFMHTQNEKTFGRPCAKRERD